MGIIGSSVEDTYKQMLVKLDGIVPEPEIKVKAEIVYEIQKLKKEKGAYILGHNYMEPALYHTVPDYVGDSLELSRKAAEAKQDIIIFCGVKFMAETAKILNPNRTVLLPAKEAGCSLAGSITAEDVRKLKAQFPGAPVVTYINTYADVKAETDICCTSGNASKIINSLKEKQIIFLPDEYLAKNVANETGKEIYFPKLEGGVINFNVYTKYDKNLKSQASNLHTININKPSNSNTDLTSSQIQALDTQTLIGWSGKCEVHDQFTVDDITSVRSQYPDVIIMSHPECPPEVVAHSDFTGSTSKMIDYIKKSDKKKYLLLTECSMADNVAAENKDKEMLRLCSVRCPHMNQITLEDTLNALRNNVYAIELEEDIIKRARGSLDRMLSMS